MINDSNSIHIIEPPEIKRNVGQFTRYITHFHSFYELYYFLEGDADYLVEGREYHLTPHSLILLSPNVFHGVKVNSDAPYVRTTVYFTPEQIEAQHRSLLLAPFPGYQKNSPKEVFYEQTESFGLYECIKNMIESQKQPSPLREQYYCIYLESLLAQISLMYQCLEPSGVTVSAPDTISDIIVYLNEHLAEDISLDGLSERFFISKYYMNRAFKKATGTTVMDYLIYKRIIAAKQLIFEGNTATDAAAGVGFDDYSAFYRAYRKVTGHSPAADKRGGIPT